jgi:hypothetical protein
LSESVSRSFPSNRRADQPQDRQGRHALAAATFPNDAERLGAIHVKGDAIDRSRYAVVGVEERVEVVDLEERFGHAL